ncbi:MAG: LAGLIDADG family homing endonuclease, partial [Peptostreptococcales bacterium]
MDIEENVPEITSPILPDIELQKKKEEARERYKKLSQRGKKPVIKVVTGDGVIKDVDKLTVKEQEEQFIKCALDPIYFIETYLKIFDQTQGENGMIVPFKLFQFQKDLITEYLNNDFNIANKYRQAGISTCTCAYLSWYVMFNKNRSVAIIADKLGTAQDELMNDVVEFIEGCPTWLKPKPTRKNTQKLKRYDNGSEIGAFAAKSGLRGYTPTLLFWDETAWTEKSDKFWESAGPTLQTGGSAVMVSCVTDDTYLFTNKGIKQVKDFTNNKKEGENYIDDTNILGFNNLRKTNIFFNNGYVDTLKIKTMYSELESSFNHKYWGYKNGRYDWFKAEELNVGDYVSIQKNKNIWGSNDDCSDFTPYYSGKIKNVFNPRKITKDLAYFIGLYISEGYIRRSKTKKNGGQIIITCGDDVSNIYERLNIPYKCSDGIHYVTNSYNLLEFFEYLGFDITKKASEKIIPSRLLEMSRENIIAMIQGIMDGDGFATYKEKGNQLRVGITLSSKELINQLKIIFNNFGILTDYDERVTPPTKKVKVYSKGYRIMATSEYAKKYFDEIGFRFERKNEKKKLYKIDEIGHVGVRDNIPNGRIILKELYDNVKYYGIYEKLELNNIKIKSTIQKKNEYHKPSSRKTILKLINLFKNELSVELLNKYKHILNEDIVWVKIKSIEKSKNYTYDFSMSNDNPVEDDEFNMSIIYNQFLTHQTPNGYDPIFYKTFNLALQKKNNFKAIELYWFNDPR